VGEIRPIDKTVEVAASRDAVWDAWTTSEGAKTFFAPDARIRLELGGPYEILFDLDEAPGKQGSEGMRVLSFLPGEMLSFEWSAPPTIPEAREGPRSFVVVELAPLGPARTRVRLVHLGFEGGPRAEDVRSYFARAWDMVMAWLEHRFAKGPIDWNAPPRPSRSYDTPGA
jgi:uncharacterized protein YndB with AHSA1/START domain